MNDEYEAKMLRNKEYILSLTNNWDCDGAVPFTTEQWELTEQFIRYLLNKYEELTFPRIRAVVDNTIDIDWIFSNGKVGINLVFEWNEIHYIFRNQTTHIESDGILSLDISSLTEIETLIEELIY